MKNRKLSFILVISIVLLFINLIPVSANQMSIIPITEVWQVGDWVTYENGGGFIMVRVKYIAIYVTPDFVGFTTDFIGFTPVNTTTDQPSEPLNLTRQEEIRAILLNGLQIFYRVDLSILFDSLKTLEVTPFIYKSNSLVYIDGNPMVIPVTGVTYEYSNTSETLPYNYTTFNWTDYSSETTLVQEHTNHSIQFEIHESTGILVNYLYTTYSNTTLSLLNIPKSMSMYLRLTDSHGLFDSSEEPIIETSETETTISETSTSKKTPYRLEIIGLALIVIACVYIRKRR